MWASEAHEAGRTALRRYHEQKRTRKNPSVSTYRSLKAKFRDLKLARKGRTKIARRSLEITGARLAEAERRLFGGFRKKNPTLTQRVYAWEALYQVGKARKVHRHAMQAANRTEAFGKLRRHIRRRWPNHDVAVRALRKA